MSSSKFARLSEVELPSHSSALSDEKQPPDPPGAAPLSPLTGDDDEDLDTARWSDSASDSDHDGPSTTSAPTAAPSSLLLPDAADGDDTDDEEARVTTSPFHGARASTGPSHRIHVPAPSSSTTSAVPSSVSLPFLTQRSATLFGVSARTIYYGVVVPSLLVVFVLLPFIIVLLFYLTFAQLLWPLVLALLLPTLLYHVVWRAYLQVNPTPFAASASHADRVWLFFLKVHRTWQQEVYQLLLTLLSCFSFILYTYHLSYTPSSSADPSASYGSYEVDFSEPSEFIQLEYFLIVSFSLDYLLGFFVAVHKWRHVLSYYGVIDLACFIGVSYFSFFPQDALYNYYLLQGPLRFMRMRRALKGLDHLVQSKGRTPVLYRWGAVSLTKQNAMLALVSFRLFLYLMSTAALVLAVEFPCRQVATHPELCTGVLQRFHLCVYFVVISISTVGYGDIVCVTDLGRMLMIFVVIGALVQVPVELDAWKEVQKAARERQVKEEEEERRRTGGPVAPSAVQTPRDAVAVDEEVEEEQRQQWLRWCEQRLLELHSEQLVRALCEAADVQWTSKAEVSRRPSSAHASSVR